MVTMTLRIEMNAQPGAFAALAAAMSDAGASVQGVDMRSASHSRVIRDITVTIPSEHLVRELQRSIRALPDMRIVSFSDSTFLAHLGGKLSIEPKIPIKTRADLAMLYTPGVARVAMAIAADPSKAHALTMKRNCVAVVTDGSAVLGLGEIGALGAIPVMEGKAMLFKRFANIDAFPICIDTMNVDEIVDTVVHIAPVFGGINLEDISAPRCFEIEERLQGRLDIPVMHDDQHGTAVVVVAALMNASRVVGKKLSDMTIVVAGTGAAGTATMKMLLHLGVGDIIPVDRNGALRRGERYDRSHWSWLAEHTNSRNRSGSLGEVLEGADAFIGVSAPGTLTVDMIRCMAKDPIVFALANPTPEIMPEEAGDVAAVLATGRSDYPNQINNLLSFPGIFRGALDARATRISDAMKVAAARAIAASVSDRELGPEYIVPSIFDHRVVEAVASAVAVAATSEGIARRTPISEQEEDATSVV